ncbi:hypothetical protein K491DRAFT_721051 [Lophiostoma macrostomum CBS 122681]|uniref:Uncharacterized protein n=1 Tax=Lophiostoma macrostomum CBS 122681 TaxID=1314788 RepID=A0A6A6SUN0_9PLEO|nr:hypothetical protein K491DRAFT_721051 [Lophiostoma macrostomum CBS 122681]
MDETPTSADAGAGAAAVPKPQTPAPPTVQPSLTSTTVSSPVTSSLTINRRHKRHNTSVSSKDRVKLFLDLGSLPPPKPSHHRESSQEPDPEMSTGPEIQFLQMQDQTPERRKVLERCHVAGPDDGVAVRDFASCESREQTRASVKAPPVQMYREEARKSVGKRRKEWKIQQRKSARRVASQRGGENGKSGNSEETKEEPETLETVNSSKNEDTGRRHSSLPEFLAGVCRSLKRS